MAKFAEYRGELREEEDRSFAATTAAVVSKMALPSFATLVNSKVLIPSTKTPYLAVEKHFLQKCLRPFVQEIRLDEAWYVRQNPDVAEGIRRRLVASAREHYVEHGFYENRMPYDIRVDEPWYLEQYPDVRAAVEREQYASAQAHFYAVGFGEGRLPYAGFTL